MAVPALISAGASFLGGLFGRNSQKKAQARQNEYDKPINMRKRMEEGGFNPLLGVAGLSMNQQSVNHQPIMGNAIASAGMAYAGAMRDKQELDLERQKLELQTKELDELLKRQTIRPKVGGVYASNQLTPSRGGVGSSSASPSYQGNIGPYKYGDDAPPVMVGLNHPTTDVSNPARTGINLFGYQLKPYHGNSDAEEGEMRYGDAMSWLIGASNFAGDLYYNRKEMAEHFGGKLDDFVERNELGKKHANIKSDFQSAGNDLKNAWNDGVAKARRERKDLETYDRLPYLKRQIPKHQRRGYMDRYGKTNKNYN